MTTADGPAPIAPSRRGQATRRRLVEAAQHRFEQAGYEGASLSSIAKDGGLTTGAIYQHFAGKLDLLLGVLARYDDELQGEMASATDLDALFATWFAVNRVYGGGLRACEELINSESDVAAAVHQVRRRTASTVAALVEHGSWIPDHRLRPLRSFDREGDAPVWAQVLVDTVDYLSLEERRGWISLQTPAAARTLRVILRDGMFIAGNGSDDHGSPEDAAIGPKIGRSSRRMLSWSPAPGRNEPTSARGRETVRRIQEAANAVFAESGLSGISMEDIAQRTKVSAGTAYQYFADKEDLFRSLQAAVEDELYYTSLFPADSTGRLVVAPTYVESIGAYRRNAGIYRAWRESLSTDPSQADSWRRMFGGFLDQLGGFFQRGARHHIVPSELDPEVAAEAFSALVQQPMYVHVLHGWYAGCSDEDLAHVVEAIVRGDLVAVP